MKEGTALGHLVTLALSDEDQANGESICRHNDDDATIRSKLRDVMVTIDGMEEFLEEHPMFLHILVPVIKHKHKQLNRKVVKLLRDINELEAACIGKALSRSIFFRTSSDAAVHEWIGKYPALRQLARENAWFVPMMDAIAQHLVAKSKKGAMFRLALGVGISMSDLISDVNMIIVFFGTPGLEDFGWALLGMLLACMLIGLVVAYFQNRKKSKWEIMKECLYVALGLMPGVAAYRVAKGKKQNKDELMDSKLELAFTKSIEMFAEGSKLRNSSLYVSISTFTNPISAYLSHPSSRVHLADLRSIESP
jgi:hypothetical protein